MCYEIKKPITEKQRADFIVEYNHNQGLRIEDTEMFLFALEPDEIMGEKEIEIDVVDPETDETHKETITVPYPVKDPDYGKKQAEKERKRLDALTLTPSDVERALYKAKEMDFEDLKALIAEKAPQLDMKALAIEFRANNFYRGVEVNGMRLIDTVGALLGYTPADMDYLFTHKELPAVEDFNGSNSGEQAS